MKKEVLVFMHIPKTAGTTWRSILYRQYPDGTVCPVYDDDGYYYSHKEFDALADDRKRKINAVIGHFGSNFIKRLPANVTPRLATFVRDPVERCLSFFNHLSNHQRKGGALTVSRLIDEKEIQLDNQQVRWIAGLNPPFGGVNEAMLDLALARLENYALVGLTDRFIESYAMAILLLGWEVVPFKPQNIGREKDIDAEALVSQGERERLAEINRFDVLLVQRVREKFDAMARDICTNQAERWRKLLHAIPLAMQEEPKLEAQGFLGQVTPNRVRGWARLLQSDTAAIVRISVNDTMVGEVAANRFRGHLQVKGLEPAGRCGFEIALPEDCILKAGDRVEALIVNTGQQLRQSPSVFAGSEVPSSEAPTVSMVDQISGKVMHPQEKMAVALEPFFILGCVRSGTTMLRDILRHHPNLESPEETHFYRWAEPFRAPEFDAKYRNAGVLKRHREIDGISEADFLQIYQASKTRREFTIAYMKKFLAIKGAQEKRWYDKTPQNVYGLPLLMADFPNAKFVHIVRNPLDVVASLRIGKVMKVADIVGAANYWRESVEIISVIKERFPERFIEFRYEDFSLNPLGHLEQVMRFIGEDFDPEHFSSFKIKAVSHEEKDILSQEEKDLVRSICSVQMRRFGYL